jgi:hypothetical protein
LLLLLLAGALLTALLLAALLLLARFLVGILVHFGVLSNGLARSFLRSLPGPTLTTTRRRADRSVSAAAVKP